MIGAHLASVLTPLPVLIPMLGAAATLIAGRRPRLQRAIVVSGLSAVVAVSAALLYLADRDGTLALQVGGWGPTEDGLGPLGVTLVVDRLSALMLVVSSIVLLAVVFYAIGQGIRDGDERQPVSIFLPTYSPAAATTIATSAIGSRRPTVRDVSPPTRRSTSTRERTGGRGPMRVRSRKV